MFYPVMKHSNTLFWMIVKTVLIDVMISVVYFRKGVFYGKVIKV